MEGTVQDALAQEAEELFACPMSDGGGSDKI